MRRFRLAIFRRLGRIRGVCVHGGRGGAVPEERGDPVLAAAAAVALNFPMGMALGVVAVRTGSLALPVAVHVSLHLMKDMLA